VSVFGITLEYFVGGQQHRDPFQSMSVAFERAGGDVSDFGRFVWPRLAASLEESNEEQFDAEGHGPNSGKWASLSEKYKAWKESHVGSLPILQFTGALKDALTRSSSPFAFREFGLSDFAFGSIGVDYASFHQTGTDDMVARPPFDFGRDTEKEIEIAARLGVNDAIKNSRVEEFVEVVN